MNRKVEVEQIQGIQIKVEISYGYPLGTARFPLIKYPQIQSLTLIVHIKYSFNKIVTVNIKIADLLCVKVRKMV